MHSCDNIEAVLRTLQAPRRNHFFYGKRMDVQHFQMEQDYGKLKQWLLNRLTFGKGVVCGLEVSTDGKSICVDPGFAIDGLGREIVVPVRACIDPGTQEDGCCTPHGAETGAAPSPRADSNPERFTIGPAHLTRSSVEPAPPAGDGNFTLWLCYKECRTDYQPVLVSECGAREPCAPGTVVEAFYLKITPGIPPLQGDPDWCAHLWPNVAQPSQPARPHHRIEVHAGDLQPTIETAEDPAARIAGMVSGTRPASSLSRVEGTDAEHIKNLLGSRRYILCKLFDAGCEVPEGDPCVPLAAFHMEDNRVAAVESCGVRPRIYSNAVLLDLILCLADKIEDCCEEHPPIADLMRVRSIDFVHRNADGSETPVASVASPTTDTPVPLAGNTNAIRIRFTKPFARDQQHAPRTHERNDPNQDFKRHNVQVLPGRALGGFQYVPGKLTIEAPDTIRFDLHVDSPYVQNHHWVGGRYRIFLRGEEDLQNGRYALADLSSKPLDGEPIAPAVGAMSGNGIAGGDFNTTFTVG